jgi:Protein of unknown function (DUF4446)
MTTPLPIYILCALIVVLSIWILILDRRIKRFFVGTSARDLETVMSALGTNMRAISDAQKATDLRIDTVNTKLASSIRNIQTVRFNPFLDAGSNQSFALSFLNDNGDGVILSSLYARDRMSVFAKPIIGGTSEFELSTEEKEVLEKSR